MPKTKLNAKAIANISKIRTLNDQNYTSYPRYKNALIQSNIDLCKRCAGTLSNYSADNKKILGPELDALLKQSNELFENFVFQKFGANPDPLVDKAQIATLEAKFETAENMSHALADKLAQAIVDIDNKIAAAANIPAEQNKHAALIKDKEILEQIAIMTSKNHMADLILNELNNVYKNLDQQAMDAERISKYIATEKVTPQQQQRWSCLDTKPQNAAGILGAGTWGIPNTQWKFNIEDRGSGLHVSVQNPPKTQQEWSQCFDQIIINLARESTKPLKSVTLSFKDEKNVDLDCVRTFLKKAIAFGLEAEFNYAIKDALAKQPQAVQTEINDLLAKAKAAASGIKVDDERDDNLVVKANDAQANAAQAAIPAANSGPVNAGNLSNNAPASPPNLKQQIDALDKYTDNNQIRQEVTAENFQAKLKQAEEFGHDLIQAQAALLNVANQLAHHAEPADLSNVPALPKASVSREEVEEMASTLADKLADLKASQNALANQFYKSLDSKSDELAAPIKSRFESQINNIKSFEANAEIINDKLASLPDEQNNHSLKH